MLFLSAFVCAGGSVAILFKGSERGDRVAVAAAELIVLFGVCMLTSGPLWGRKAWGVWWQWDTRLTSSLLLFMMMVGYLLARRYGGPAGRKLAAALALFAAINVPIVYKSVDIWRTIHPPTTVVQKLDPHMRTAFWSSVLLMTLVWTLLLTMRARLERARAELAELRLAAEDGGGRSKTTMTTIATMWKRICTCCSRVGGAGRRVRARALAQQFQKVCKLAARGDPRQSVRGGRVRHHLVRGHRLRRFRRVGGRARGQEIADLKRKVDQHGTRS